MYLECLSSSTAKTNVSNYQQKNWYDLIEDIQSIDDDECNHTTVILVVAFHKPTVEANSSV